MSDAKHIKLINW